MAAKGARAKEIVTEKIGEVFSQLPNTKYIGVVDKKIYVNVLEDDTNETVQVCIALTCPKNPVGGEVTPMVSFNAVSDMPDSNDGLMSAGSVNGTPNPNFEFTAEEMANLDKIMAKLDLDF